MGAALKVVGAALGAIGLATVIVFGVYVVRDEEYARAALLAERNPGNIIYEARYGAASLKRALLICGAAAGALLTLNGITFLLLGAIAARQGAGEASGRSGGARKQAD